MALVLTNTLSGKKELLVPREPGHVRIYWCGVTVYSRSHIGHARALLSADVLCRWLRARGQRVTFVRNFTDIEDKIIARAATEGITTEALVEREIRAFAEDVAWLRCLPPTIEPRATTHITDMVALIERLVAKGLAYAVPDGSVYFRVRGFAAYGKLSHRRLEDMGQSDEIDPDKESAQDFALWKGAKPGEPTWPSPWGAGRPGWHIECSAMAARYLGDTFDIHGGGSDLIFPHHENEIAQSEGDTGVPFANLWVHNGMLTSGSEKMSKSLGNILSIPEVAQEAPAEALRTMFLGTHYRAPLDFSRERLADVLRALDRLYESLARADEALGAASPPSLDDAFSDGHDRSAFLDEFASAMDDDLNAAKALGLVFDRFRDLNRALDADDRAEASIVREELLRAGVTLGLFAMEPAAYVASRRTTGRERAGLTEAQIETEITARKEARARRDFAAADAIRDRLKDQGIVLVDSPNGTTWKSG